MRPLYQKMAEALRKTGRPIVYSICQYGRANVQEWGPKAGGNLWRTTFDIRDQWESMVNIGFSQSELAPFAKPGHWNDPDMLEVGNGAMSPTEYRTHFSLWALLAAPLLAGNDIRKLDEATKEVLLNKEVIAVNQDLLGKAGYRVTKNGDTEVWAKPLSGGGYAVGLFNLGASAADIEVAWSELKLPDAPRVRDLWRHSDMGRVQGSLKMTTPSHGVVLVRVTP
jgi:alpha-galactosidase